MSRHGKAPAVDASTEAESDQPQGHLRGGRRVYVEGKKGPTTICCVGPSSSVAYATAVEGLSIDSCDTEFPLCSELVRRADLSPDTAISPGEWAIPWQTDETTPPFVEHFTHHQPPSGPIPDNRQIEELVGRWDFVDTNVPEPGEAKPVTRLPTARYARMQNKGFT